MAKRTAMHKMERVHSSERMLLDTLPQPDYTDAFAEAVRLGFKQSIKVISPKFFYDKKGSQLFEDITNTPEYYVTRTEEALIKTHITTIAQCAQAIASNEVLSLVELGSGSSRKTRPLIKALLQQQKGLVYRPIDISPTVVQDFGEKLLQAHPALSIRALICDYHQAMATLQTEEPAPRVFIFLGSSLGNFNHQEALHLLCVVAETMTPQDSLLLGVDLKKDTAVLNAAYNDASGVTAAFNLNLLSRMNSELEAQFDLDLFAHLAFYNKDKRRIEMHLESLVDQITHIKALGESYSFRKGERIHTENSYKFDRALLEEMCEVAGLSLNTMWTDEKQWFGLTFITKPNA